MDQSLGQRIKHLRGDARRAAIQRVLQDFRESGQSRTAFCRGVGIAVVTLGRWEAEIGHGKRTKATEPEFVEVGRGGVGAFELMLPGGMELRVPRDFIEADLRRLLRAVAAAC